jgi:hypothetical protein
MLTIIFALIGGMSPHPATADTIVPRRLDGSTDWAQVFSPRHQELADPAGTGPQEPRRARAIQYSDGYYRRLGIHRALSFAMIPLFVGQFITGSKLINDPDTPEDDWRRKLHKPLAIGTGIVFTTNTITGLWNLIESSKNPVGRTRRWAHGLAMLAADAGFAYTGIVLSDKAQKDPTMRNDHRNLALASMGVAVTSWTIMLVWN